MEYVNNYDVSDYYVRKLLDEEKIPFKRNHNQFVGGTEYLPYGVTNIVVVPEEYVATEGDRAEAKRLWGEYYEDAFLGSYLAAKTVVERIKKRITGMTFEEMCDEHDRVMRECEEERRENPD